jgi:hypothetical protein
MPLGRLCIMCHPFVYEFRVIPPANEFQWPNLLTFKEPRNRFRQAGNLLLGSFKGLQIRVRVCYTAILFTTEAVDKRVDPYRHLAHLSSRIAAGGHVYLVMEACKSRQMGRGR